MIQETLTGGLPSAEITRCLNNFQDQLEALLERLLILEERVNALGGKND